MIDLEKEKESDGKSTIFLRGTVNPNLHLYKEYILNKDHEILKKHNDLDLEVTEYLGGSENENN